ncbi:kinesin light chain 1 [Colletotrichum incanum]|uniref:Kinesin light chain 1 n=1 Tax=Colletotrichum incanum TaxID=1573173 RepID=A0A161W6L1_COLIC|nr:kinesin light chain 1 [Colletotrichum incanum]
MYERALQGYEKALGPNAIKSYIPALNTLQNLGSLFKKLEKPRRWLKARWNRLTGHLKKT